MSLSIASVSQLLPTTASISHAPTLDELENKLFAVHATRYLPSSCKIQAGIANLPSLFPDIRSTLHFSLGELVRPVDGVISWDDCPYALVCPLKQLMPQLVNINCYDTFILGDLEINSSMILVVPKSMEDKVPHGVSFYPYEPSVTTLRESVDEVIKSGGGWKITMSEEDREDELAPALIDGSNINTSSFFEPLFSKHSTLSIGCRYKKMHGDSYLLGKLENMAYELAHYYLMPAGTGMFSSEMPLERVEKRFLELNSALFDAKTYAKDLTINSSSIDSYLSKLESLNNLLSIAHHDIQLRKSLNKTLYGVDVKQLELMIAEKPHFERWIEKNLAALPDCRA